MTYYSMLRSQLKWASEDQILMLSEGNKEILKFFTFILQYLAVASVLIVLCALILIFPEDTFINYSVEIMYCARHVSIILLAYGITNSIKKEV